MKNFTTTALISDILSITGMSAIQLSRATGLHKGTISNYLSGKRQITPERLTDLLDKIGLDIEYRLKYQGNPDTLISPEKLWKEADELYESAKKALDPRQEAILMGRFQERRGIAEMLIRDRVKRNPILPPCDQLWDKFDDFMKKPDRRSL